MAISCNNSIKRISKGLILKNGSVLFSAFLLCFSQSLAATVTVVSGPVLAALGDNATLGISIDETVGVCTWYRGIVENLNIILEIKNGNQTEGPKYTHRESLLQPSHSLRIANATLEDSGTYNVLIVFTSFNRKQSSVTLKVLALLSKPIVTINPEVVEQGHNVTLQCVIADRTDTVFSWHKNNQSINCSADIRCSEDRPDLYIPFAEENDKGNYSCSVRNPVSSNASETVELMVFVRVSKPIVTVTPEVVKEGDHVTLNCNTTAGNHLTYTWYINSSEPKCGDHYECSNESSDLIIKAAKPADTGNYSCTAQNRLNNETSDFTSMTVYYGPASLALHIPADTCPNDWIDWFKVPEAVCVHENSSLKMSCEAQSLPQSNYSWSFSNATYTGVLIEASKVEMYNFNKENDGNYTCTASNDVTGRDSSQSRYLITYRAPNGNATITYSKKGDNNLNVSCSWSGGVPPAKVLLELDNISKNGTEEVNTEVGQGRVSCVGQHLFLKSETALLLEKPKPETNISNPSEIIATDEQEVTLLVTLSSGGKMLNRAQSDNKEILPATFKWFHPNEGEIPGNGNDKYRISSTTQQSVFVISEFAGEKDRGIYRCTVTNILGSMDFTFHIDIKQAGPNVGLIVGATIGAIAAAVLIGVAIYFIVKYANKKKVQYHKEERQAAANGNPEKDKAIPLEDTSTQKVSKSGDNEIQYAELPVLQKQGLKLPRVEVPNTLYSHIKTG